MSSRFLLQFLGFWLLLSQAYGTQTAKQWLDEVIHVCGIQYVRAVLDICGRSLKTLGMEPTFPRSRPVREAVLSFLNKDAEPVNTVLESKAALSEGHPSLPEQQQTAPGFSDLLGGLDSFERSFHNTQGEAEDSSPRERLNALSRKKRENVIWLSDQCCSHGCPRRAIAEFC